MDDRAIPLDAETKVTERPADHEAELRLWLRLLTCTTLIEGEVRRRLRDEFDVTLWEGNVVTIYRAKSQSSRTMKKQEFQESKSAVLDYVAGMIHTSRKDLEDNARRVA